MATDFPTSLDDFTRPTASDPMDTPSHAEQHDNAYDAIEAVQAKVGIGASAATDATEGSVLTKTATAGTTAYSPSPIMHSLTRQAIINGNFDIWQRGTTFTSVANAAFTADRFQMLITGSSATVSRQLFPLGFATLPYHSTYYWRAVTTSAAGAGNRVLVQTKIENVRSLSNGKATLSFWARADASKNIAVELLQNFGTSGSPSAAVTGIGATKVALTTDFTYHTVTFDVPSINGKTLGTDNNDFLSLVIWFDAGSDFNARTDSLGQQSGTFDIAQVQLCAGEVALPFQPKSYEEELRACCRYFWTINSPSGDTTSSRQTVGFGHTNGTTTAQVQCNFPTNMRVFPTLSTAGTLTLSGNAYAATPSSVNISSPSYSGAIVSMIVATTTADMPRSLAVRTDTDGTAHLSFSAEL